MGYIRHTTMNSPRDSLDELLAAWRVQPRRDPQFRARVWAKVQAARSPASWPGYVRGHAVAIGGALALALMFGAMGGRSQARARAAAESERLASAYVEALDARNMRMP